MPWLAFPPPSLASLLLPPSPLRPRLASAMAARRAFLRSITSKLPITSSSGTRNWLTPALGSHHRPDAYDQRDRFGRSSRVGDRVGQLQQWKGQQIREYQDCGLQVDEARRLLKQVNMESLRKQLHANGHKEFVTYEDLVHLCRQTGVAASEEAAERFVQALDEAGVVLIFRGKVFLHPEEIAEKVADVLPSLLLFEDDGHKQEFELLQKELEDIDTKASRQVRNYLWMGLLSLTSGTVLFFRLTFWEFSWDVMEPIAFFVTTGGLIGSYAYFLVTHRDPTYLGLMHSLLTSRRKKLMKRRQFNFDRYRQLESLCHSKTNSGLEKQETAVNVTP